MEIVAKKKKIAFVDLIMLTPPSACLGVYPPSLSGRNLALGPQSNNTGVNLRLIRPARNSMPSRSTTPPRPPKQTTRRWNPCSYHPLAARMITSL
jgi:hypothetical protein